MSPEGRHPLSGLLCSAAATAIALLVAGAAPAHAALEPAFAWSGSSCTQVAATVSAPEQSLRAAVPPQFTVLSSSGQGTVQLNVMRCAGLDVEGSPGDERIVADVAVPIASPDGSAGSHLYDLWQLTDHSELRSRMRALGAIGDLVEGMGLGADFGPLIGHGSASIPWSLSPYSLSVDALPGSSTGPVSYTLWQQGADGPLRLSYSVSAGRVQPGNANVSAAQDSPLAHVLGGSASSGSGVIARFDVNVAVAATPKPAPAPAPVPAPAPAAVPQLRLAIFPGAVRVGRRAKFLLTSFRYYFGRRRAVGGAVVRFAGRRLVTNRFGHRLVFATFAVARVARAYASHAGFRPTSVIVRAIRPVPRGGEPGEQPCFGSRFPVKTVSDPRAGLVDPRPLPISVTALWLLRPPRGLAFRTPRLPGLERHVYRVVARLVSVQVEPDLDIHLVIASPGHPTRTMITELPYAGCYSVAASRFRNQMVAARLALTRACGAAGERQRRIVGSAVVTGVGFWDKRHGQFGVARNAVELHPVLGFQSLGCRTARAPPRRR